MHERTPLGSSPGQRETWKLLSHVRQQVQLHRGNAPHCSGTRRSLLIDGIRQHQYAAQMAMRAESCLDRFAQAHTRPLVSGLRKKSKAGVKRAQEDRSPAWRMAPLGTI